MQNDELNEASPKLVSHYKNILKAGEGRKDANESADVGGEPDLSDGVIRERLNFSRSELHRIVRDHLGDVPDLYAIADRITADASEALRVLRDEDEAALRERSGVLDGLEAIVRTDGSRPSFLVRNDQVDRSTSPIGTSCE